MNKLVLIVAILSVAVGLGCYSTSADRAAANAVAIDVPVTDTMRAAVYESYKRAVGNKLMRPSTAQYDSEPDIKATKRGDVINLTAKGVVWSQTALRERKGVVYFIRYKPKGETWVPEATSTIEE